MNATTGLKTCVAVLVVLGAVVWLVGGGASCGTAPTAFVVQGLAPTGNTAPTLEITEPTVSLTKGRGEPFPIEWIDSDRDSNALIRFDLINTLTNTAIPLVDNIPENDDIGPDSVSAQTSLVPLGSYHIRGMIDDSVNLPVSVFASDTSSAVATRVVLLLVEPGQGPPTDPPTIAVTQPSFNRSVAQDDELQVVVQPTAFFDANQQNNPPFDSDSDVTLYVLLDTDLDPNNDDPANPDTTKIIVLRQQNVTAGNTQPITFNIPIDLNEIPPRTGGEPYYIRATADDGSNPRVHQYAVGTISVVELASGSVDLFDIGRSKSGTRIYGFNPGANLGSSVSHVSDFDQDGVDDFVVGAQFGNPRNFGLLGEAYLLYGQDRVRFGGSIAANTISETVDGVVFEGPPIRAGFCPDTNARTDGIQDISFIRDLTGDGRPELLFGLPHVHCAYDSMDFDPGDEDIAGSDNAIPVNPTVRQGQIEVTIGVAADSETLPYFGVSDLTISSAAPDTKLGSEPQLAWQDNGIGQREWALIKFRDLLALIPSTDVDIEPGSIQATLQFRVFNTGGTGSIHECLTDFNELTTFRTFAQNGAEPEPGIDYVVGALGTIDGASSDFVTVDVSELVRRLIEGVLPDESNDELRFIIVPDPGEGEDQTAVRSSDFGTVGDRPLLNITFNVINFIGAQGCYPDFYVNNESDDDEQDPRDTQWYAGGMALVVNSDNRDNDPRFSEPPQRLTSTSVALELVGQRSVNLNGITARADDYQEVDRIAGARFVAGFYDFVDAFSLGQPARDGLFGQTVGSIGDLNNDGVDELIFSAPRNQSYLDELFIAYGFDSTHLASTTYQGSIVVFPGSDYSDADSRDTGGDGTATTPRLDQQDFPPFGKCSDPPVGRHLSLPVDAFQIFAEEVDDCLGNGQSAGDFNQDGIDDILCGAPRNDTSTDRPDTGETYIIFGRNGMNDIHLNFADDPIRRSPMVRIRGVKPGDQIGWTLAGGLDVNGGGVSDVFFGSPTADFGGVTRATCVADFDGNGTIDSADLSESSFIGCRDSTEDVLFSGDACKAFDYDYDGDIDNEDESVFQCLAEGGTNCCVNLVNNGFVGVVFGQATADGDFTLNQIATSDLPGTVFFGAAAGHRAGHSVSSAGDFNQDGFGDILITAPGESKLDRAGRERLGVVYLIFGGTHLNNTRWNLSQVGSGNLPGIVFLSPYVTGRPNEAAPTVAEFIGDINNDGFGDIAIGNPKADFINLNFPQGPDATDSQLGRRRDAGDLYVIYGNNFGSNRITP